MAGNPLEDFASGIGPGAYSPQQGSGLPSATNGGLAFGASSPTPPPAVPGPNFQAAPQQRPGFQLGGPSPDVEAMIRQRLQLLQGPQDRSMAGLMGHDRALDELKGLSSLASARSQDRQLQAQSQKQVLDLLSFQHTLTDDQKAKSLAVLAPILRNMVNTAGGNQIPDDAIHDALKSANVGAMFPTLLNDPLLKHRKDADLARILSSKEREKTAKELDAEHSVELDSLIETHLPQAALKYGGTPDAPTDAAAFEQALRKDPEIGALLKQSPRLERQLNAYLNDPKRDATLAKYGLKSAKTAQLEQEEALKAKTLFQNLKEYPQTVMPYLTTVSGLPLAQMNRMAVEDPHRFAAYMKAAQEAENAVLADRAFQTSGSTALAKLKVPEKASDKQREAIIDGQQSMELGRRMSSLYNPDFVGPITGPAGSIREKWTGAIKDKEVNFRQSVTEFNNALIKQLGGVVVPPQEFERIMAERAHVNLPPVTFEARMKQTNENVIFLEYIRRQTLQQTGTDVSGLAPLPPLPARFKGNPALFKKDDPKPMAPIQRTGPPTATGRP